MTIINSTSVKPWLRWPMLLTAASAVPMARARQRYMQQQISLCCSATRAELATSCGLPL
jgi:hypothetical protein